MRDWHQTGPGQSEPNESPYLDSLHKLRLYVTATIKKAEEYANHLSPQYTEEALSSISSHFEKVSKEYTDTTIVAINPFYEVVQRSKLRLNAVKKVAQRAKKLAQLFEKYVRKRNSYSAVNARLEINKLVGELKNLETYCEDGKKQ